MAGGRPCREVLQSPPSCPARKIGENGNERVVDSGASVGRSSRYPCPSRVFPQSRPSSKIGERNPTGEGSQTRGCTEVRG